MYGIDNLLEKKDNFIYVTVLIFQGLENQGKAP